MSSVYWKITINEGFENDDITNYATELFVSIHSSQLQMTTNIIFYEKLTNWIIWSNKNLSQTISRISVTFYPVWNILPSARHLTCLRWAVLTMKGQALIHCTRNMKGRNSSPSQKNLQIITSNATACSLSFKIILGIGHRPPLFWLRTAHSAIWYCFVTKCDRLQSFPVFIFSR